MYRWLVANDRAAEANELLTRWHAGGERNSLVVEFEIAEITENIRQEREIISRSSYADLLQTPLLRRRTLIGIIVGFYGTWSGVAVISYYLTLVLDNVGITSAKSQTLINALLQVFNWIVAIISALLVDRVGRRAMFLISSIGMLVSFICMTVISSRFTTTQNQSLGRSVIAFIFIYQLFYNIAFNPLLQAYPLEIFPYALRGRGLTISLCTTYIGLTVGQAVNPIALEAIGWKYYNVFVGLLVMLVVFVFFLFPETKGKTLEEITPVSGGFEIDILDKDRG
jgi:MFS family permease